MQIPGCLRILIGSPGLSSGFKSRNNPPPIDIKLIKATANRQNESHRNNLPIGVSTRRTALKRGMAGLDTPAAVPFGESEPGSSLAT